MNAIDYVALAEIGIAFGLKMADNALGTVKTLYLSKGKFFGASIFASMSTLFYLLAIVRIATENVRRLSGNYLRPAQPESPAQPVRSYTLCRKANP